jgi:hypothetical protein
MNIHAKSSKDKFFQLLAVFGSENTAQDDRWWLPTLFFGCLADSLDCTEHKSQFRFAPKASV